MPVQLQKYKTINFHVQAKAFETDNTKDISFLIKNTKVYIPPNTIMLRNNIIYIDYAKHVQNQITFVSLEICLLVPATLFIFIYSLFIRHFQEI